MPNNRIKNRGGILKITKVVAENKKLKAEIEGSGWSQYEQVGEWFTNVCLILDEIKQDVKDENSLASSDVMDSISEAKEFIDKIGYMVYGDNYCE